MRPYVLAAALVAVLTVPAAAEDTCLVRVSPPGGYADMVYVEGTMTCTSWFPGMAITVCLETLTPASGAVGWVAEDCYTQPAEPGATAVSSMVWACIDGGPAVVRGRAYALDHAGRPVAGIGRPAVVAGVGACL